jgi:hypothetical protein
MPLVSLQNNAPINPKDFERLMVVVFEDLYNARFNKYGTNGQAQYGADILGEINKTNLVLQCKCYDQSLNTKLTKSDISDMIKAIDEKYPNHCDQFYILHTKPNNASLTNYVTQLNSKRTEHQAQVFLWGWDDINDRINDSPRAQKILQFSHTQSSFSNKIFLLILFIVIVGITTYFIYDNYLTRKAYQNQNSKITQDYLKEVTTKVEQLELAYVSCVETASNHLFLNSDQLQQQCVEPISKQEQGLVQLQNKYAPSVESSTYDQVGKIKDNLEKLSADTYQATLMTKSLEKSMVQNLLTIANSNGKPSNDTIIERETKNAFNFQMYAYFKNRDFNIPIIRSSKAKISSLNRLINKDSIPVDLEKQVAELEPLINKRNSYAFREYPSNISQVKNMTSNDATFENGIPLPNNEMAAIRGMSLMIGMKNNPRIIDQLIESGHIKPEIKAHLTNGKEFNPTLSLGSDKL